MSPQTEGLNEFASELYFYRPGAAGLPAAGACKLGDVGVEGGVVACAGSRISTAVRGKLKLPPASSITFT
ncbi:MAG: hypothetical protein WAK33_26165, partial [Silvibacterium sp.]